MDNDLRWSPATDAVPIRQVRAVYDDETITVYQAYSPHIAEAAVRAGTFVAPFSMTRMTWIKPSFLWMMYRCGWATKPGQERVLAVRMSRAGFEDALRHSCPSHYAPNRHPNEASWRRDLKTSPVRIQWDPERTREGLPLPHRSLQVGLGPQVVPSYVHDWARSIEDITSTLPDRRNGAAEPPTEQPYPLPREIALHIRASS